MKGKAIAFVCALSVVAAMLALPVCPSAKYYTDYELSELEKQMDEQCEEILYEVYHDEYWDGGCAEWTSDQLKLRGIGYWYRGYNSYGYDDGYDWFAGLDDGAVTNSGYTQVKYPGKGCLYDLIYEYGGYPIHNVVLSWELGNDEWAASGHVVYVWCIYDGYVYYADTFDQYLFKAGHIIKQPVGEFLTNYEATNGTLLGAVHFEGDEEAHFKPNEELHSVYEAKSDITLHSAPAYTLNGESTESGSAVAGERFIVRGAYNADDGTRWYKIEGGMWIDAENAKKTANTMTLCAQNINVPDLWCYHQGFDIVGTVISYSSDITSASIKIFDEEGNVAAGGDFKPNGATFSVGAIDEQTYFEHFKPGKYRFYVSAENAYESKVFVDSVFEIANVTYMDSTYHTVNTERSEFPASDSNIDGKTNLADLDYIKDYCLYKKGTQYFADVSGNGRVNLTDYAITAFSVTE